MARAVIAVNVRSEGIFARSQSHAATETFTVAADTSGGLQLFERLSAAIGIMRIRAVRAGTSVDRVVISSSPELQDVLALDELRSQDEVVQWVDAAVAQVAAVRATHPVSGTGTTLLLELSDHTATLRAVDSGASQSRLVASVTLTEADPAEGVAGLVTQSGAQSESLFVVAAEGAVGDSIADRLRRTTQYTVIHVTDGVDLALEGSFSLAPDVQTPRSTRPRHAAPPTTQRPSILRRFAPEKRTQRGGARRRRT